MDLINNYLISIRPFLLSISGFLAVVAFVILCHFEKED